MQRLCSQYKMYILIWLVFTNLSCSPLFAKGSLIKQSKLILLKQIHDNLSKERGTIHLKYCEFSGLTCRSFLEILNIQFRKCTFSRTFTNTTIFQRYRFSSFPSRKLGAACHISYSSNSHFLKKLVLIVDKMARRIHYP